MSRILFPNNQLPFPNAAGVTIDDVNAAILAAQGVSVAPLVSGKIPVGYIPDLALTSVQVVANQAARLALAGSVQVGDFVRQSDTGKGYLLATGNGSLDAHWILVYDADLTYADILLANGKMMVGGVTGYAEEKTYAEVKTLLGVSTGDGFTSVEKSADQTVTNSGTLVNDDHLLFTLTPQAGTIVLFELNMMIRDNSGNNPFKFSLNWGGTNPFYVDGSYSFVNFSGISGGSFEMYTGGGQLEIPSYQPINLGSNANNRPMNVIVRGGVVYQGGNGTQQTVRLKWAQQIANGVSTVLKKGSYLKYKVTQP